MGTTVGDWQLKGKLGQGGFGDVQHWKNILTKQEIATKHIKDADRLSIDQQYKMKDRWNQEYNWTQKFQQPYIVAGVKLGEESKDFINYLNKNHVWQLPVIILEYCNGGDVRKLLQRPQNANGLLELEVREILRCLRLAVDFLHRHCGICHRDLKPDNIVIHRLSDGRNQYKLTDFGLARPAPDKTMLQSVVGTHHYYAPEVVDTGKYNNKVDYWSMGIIAYEIATGTLPFIPHQKVFNIHMSIKKKPRNCIAITEDVEQDEQFHFHKNIPVAHHLTMPWQAELVKWLSLALDSDYSKRGTTIATDEVQLGAPNGACPYIFSEIDRLVEIKVLTLFAACRYKRIECVVTPQMTMPELATFIAKEAQLEISSIYLLLPTGHPHKRITRATRPIDLFVAEWCDSSEESGNPPVMVYIFSAMQHCEYSAPDPCMTDLVRHFCTNSNGNNLRNWIMERLILDMHYMLSIENSNIRTLLFGFTEYALTLEHEMLEYQNFVKLVEKESDKCYGAMEQFLTLLEAAKQQQKFHLINNAEWDAKCSKMIAKSREILVSCGKTIDHFESSLRNVRVVVLKQSTDIYKETMEKDIYDLRKFRKTYLQRGYSMSCSELINLAVKYAKVRSFLEDDRIKFLRESLSNVHFRFIKIRSTLETAGQGLKDIRAQLLQLQLEMLPNIPIVPSQQPPIFQLNNAMSRLSFDAACCDSANSLEVFDSISTQDIVSQALSVSHLMENEIHMEQS